MRISPRHLLTRLGERINEVLLRPFVRNVLVVATGTAGAQAIALIFSPIVTRLYGPEIYGVAGMFAAMVSALGPVSALTYPAAIILAETEDDAKRIAQLSFLVAVSVASLLGLILLLSGGMITSAIGLQPITPFLMLLPVAVFLTGLVQITEQQLNRVKDFGVIAGASVLLAVLVNLARAVGGLLYPAAAVLIWIANAGTLGSFLIYGGRTYLRRGRLQPSNETSRKSLSTLAREHIDFPLFRAPQSLLAAVSQSLPTLVVGSMSGPTAAGFYALSRAAIYLPVGLLGQSLQSVLYPGLSEARISRRPLSPMIDTSSRYLAIMGIPIFGVVVLWGPDLFKVIFGADWARAGQYGQWLSIWLFFTLTSRPAMSAIPLLKLQGWYLRLEILTFALRAVALVTGLFVFHDDLVAIALFSLTGAAIAAYLQAFVRGKARVADEKRLNA